MQKIFWKFLVLFFLALAYLGIIIPGLPTTVFLILATWAAAKGWPEYYEKLLNHPKYGKTLRHWKKYGTVSRKIKYIAIAMMLLSNALLYIFNTPLWLKIFSTISILAVAIWLWRLPEQPTTNSEK